MAPHPAELAKEIENAHAPPDDSLERWESRVAEAIERVRRSVVTLEYSASDAPEGPRRVASGVVISDEGDVLSVRIDRPSPLAGSPAQGAGGGVGPPVAGSEILAQTSDGERSLASWIASDPETGLTLLKIAPKETEAKSAVPSSRGPRLGIPILLIGNPFGLGHSVTRGFVSGLNRRLILGPRHLGGLIQVDATFHPGDSGALLADLRGGWLGVVRSGLAPPDIIAERPNVNQGSEKDHDLGFVIPAREALWVAGQLKAHGRVNRAYLGITMVDSRQSAIPTDHREPAGAQLDRVIANTPADRAGLRPGDRILALNGVPIHSATELTDQLDRTLAETEIEVDVVRHDDPTRARETVAIQTAERPVFEPTRLEAPPSAPGKTKVKPTRSPAGVETEVVKVAAPPLSPHSPPSMQSRVEQLEKRLRELEETRQNSKLDAEPASPR